MMESIVLYVINCVLLGVGLAMDAFSISVANGLHEPRMKRGKRLIIAGTFGVFQGIMPLIGWVIVKVAVQYFAVIDKYAPYIAFALLTYIGLKMIREAFKERKKGNKPDTQEDEYAVLTPWMLALQAVATSIDALSVGFTIEDYTLTYAVICALIIAVITFVICIAGVKIGKKVGQRYSFPAAILGGVILIGIGLEIFIKAFII